MVSIVSNQLLQTKVVHSVLYLPMANDNILPFIEVEVGISLPDVTKVVGLDSVD